MFVSIEGVDNVGKTSVCKLLQKRLSKSFQVRLISDPPDIPPWGSLRDLILGDPRITSTARAVVLLGLRIDSYKRTISPWLRKDRLLLADRFLDSWFSYQLSKIVKHFKTTTEASMFLESMNKICLRSKLLALPDRTFLIVGDISETTKRGKQKTRSVYDSIMTQWQVHRNYLKLASQSQGRIETINSTHLSIVDLANILELKIRALMPTP